MLFASLAPLGIFLPLSLFLSLPHYFSPFPTAISSGHFNQFRGAKCTKPSTQQSRQRVSFWAPKVLFGSFLIPRDRGDPTWTGSKVFEWTKCSQDGVFRSFGSQFWAVSTLLHRREQFTGPFGLH